MHIFIILMHIQLFLNDEKRPFMKATKGCNKSIYLIKNKLFFLFVLTSCYMHLKIFCNRNFKYKIGFPITWLDQSFNRLTEMVNYLLKVPYVPKLIP